MNKKLLRQDIAKKIAAMSRETRELNSNIIREKIIALKEYRAAKIVLLYVPLSDEVNITRVIEDALVSGKRVALPVVQGERMIFRVIDPSWLNHLREGSLHVMEPIDHYPELNTENAEALFILTPGRAFSEAKDRLGRGKGYYDRFLSSLSHKPFLAAAAFDLQIVHHIPTDDHDKRVDCIITEKREIR